MRAVKEKSDTSLTEAINATVPVRISVTTFMDLGGVVWNYTLESICIQTIISSRLSMAMTELSSANDYPIIPNNMEHILTVLAPFKDQLKAIAVESTFNWYWPPSMATSSFYRLW
jgi:hypothetical protein